MFNNLDSDSNAKDKFTYEPSVHAIAVHQWLAQPILLILLRDDSKVLVRPQAVEPVPGLRILNQPIYLP
jgi:hypothetical protein